MKAPEKTFSKSPRILLFFAFTTLAAKPIHHAQALSLFSSKTAADQLKGRDQKKRKGLAGQARRVMASNRVAHNSKPTAAQLRKAGKEKDDARLELHPARKASTSPARRPIRERLQEVTRINAAQKRLDSAKAGKKSAMTSASLLPHRAAMRESASEVRHDVGLVTIGAASEAAKGGAGTATVGGAKAAREVAFQREKAKITKTKGIQAANEWEQSGEGKTLREKNTALTRKEAAERQVQGLKNIDEGIDHELERVRVAKLAKGKWYRPGVKTLYSLKEHFWDTPTQLVTRVAKGIGSEAMVAVNQVTGKKSAPPLTSESESKIIQPKTPGFFAQLHQSIHPASYQRGLESKINEHGVVIKKTDDLVKAAEIKLVDVQRKGKKDTTSEESELKLAQLMKQKAEINRAQTEVDLATAQEDVAKTAMATQKFNELQSAYEESSKAFYDSSLKEMSGPDDPGAAKGTALAAPVPTPLPNRLKFLRRNR